MTYTEISAIQLSAVVDIHPDHISAFEQAVNGLIAAARSEPGVFDYQLWRHPSETGRFLLLERYADRQALDGHLAAPLVIDFVTSLPNWLSRSSYAALSTTNEIGEIPLTAAIESAQK
ncbi:putative quinol monooxygenase [Nocardia gamkensis]|uniref:putative quinol monooxygenase n=1 Tax=Nocardia gamkensis TaxID=352869 RepID=UPI0037C7DEBB